MPKPQSIISQRLSQPSRQQGQTQRYSMPKWGIHCIAAVVWLAGLGASPLALGETSFMSKQSGQSDFRPSKRAEPAFLPVDQAFKLEINRADQQTTLIWTIAPGYYLYKHKFELNGKREQRVQPLTDQTQFSRGIRKRDDYFGPVEVFYHQATAEFATPDADQIIVKYQGCADAGLCYPVQTKTLALTH